MDVAGFKQFINDHLTLAITAILFMQDNNRCGLVNQFLKASISSPLQLEWDIKYLA